MMGGWYQVIAGASSGARGRSHRMGGWYQVIMRTGARPGARGRVRGRARASAWPYP